MRPIPDCLCYVSCVDEIDAILLCCMQVSSFVRGQSVHCSGERGPYPSVSKLLLGIIDFELAVRRNPLWLDRATSWSVSYPGVEHSLVIETGALAKSCMHAVVLKI